MQILKKINFFGYIVFILLIVILQSCSNNFNKHPNAIIIGISSDIESTNPLFSYTVNEGDISELLYMSLIQYKWDEKSGELIDEPMLAKDWSWNSDSSSVTLDLRNDVYWSDGVQFTAEDVVFSFDLYSDPIVQSSRYGTFKTFEADTTLHIDINRTFEVESPFKLRINFKKNIPPDLIDLTVPLIPKHIFQNIDRKNLITIEKQIKPVTDGPFYLAEWQKNQAIILKSNERSFLHKPSGAKEIIFKVVPDYLSRITQLREGEIDLTEDIKTEDLKQLSGKKYLQLMPIKGREYDYLAWNNIDPESYKKDNKIVPNKIFGDEKVREALTYAINRNEILHEFLKDQGELAVGPIAPIFKNAIDTLLKPLQFNPKKAAKILADEGWQDINKTGVLEKNGMKFSFSLFIPSGNPLREFAATIIKNDLKEIGVDVKIETLEPQVFFERMFKHEFDAWMAGWSVAIPLDMKSYWYSDLKKTPMNFSCYQNKNADKIIMKIDSEKNKNIKNHLYKELEQIIYKDNPVTFLYWINNNVMYNKRIKDINISPLGAVYHAWNWTLNN